MKRLVLEPDGWPCTLEECPPGLFLCQKDICFKTEYRTEKGNIESYCDSGEFFWGGCSTPDDVGKIIVQPMKSLWVDE